MSEKRSIVLITGANSGVGLATSKVLARTGQYHVIMASRSREKGQIAVEEVEKDAPKGSASTIELDVTSQHSIDAAAKRVEEQFGGLDVLINNAGVYIQGADFRTELDSTFQTNLIAPAMVTQAFKPLLIKSEWPYLLYISSSLGSITVAEDRNRFDYGLDCIGYRTSKAALNMLAVQDAKILGKQGVKVFSVCPGLVESNLRGTADAARTAGGKATDPLESGRLMLSILQGKRDAEVGKFLIADGVRPW